MDIVALRKQLEIDEGIKHEIYLDHLGLPTFGINLIIEGDLEYGMEVGTEITDDRVIQAFESDLETVISDCESLYEDFDDLPEECQQIIANMMFNMGYPRLSKFKGMKAGVDAEIGIGNADEMVDSRWYRQVTNRADRLVERMRGIT